MVVWSILTQVYRRVCRHPALMLACVAILVLGIGANTLTFGIVDRLLFRMPSHIEAPESVRILFTRERSGDRSAVGRVFSLEDFKRIRDSVAFEKTAAFYETGATLGHGEDSQVVDVTAVSADFFPLLGTKPAAGRLLNEEDEQPESPRTAVLSYAFWQKQYAGSPQVVGETIDLGDLRAVVVGVAPRGFTGVDLRPVDVWVPLNNSAEPLGYKLFSWDPVGSIWLTLAVRVSGLESRAVAEERASAVLRRLNREARAHRDPDARVTAESMIAAENPGGPSEARISGWLLGVSLAVLLIACANIGNLLLVDAVRRRREMALRLSQGMSRARSIFEQCFESVAIALVGGMAALGVAYWGGEVARRALLPDLDWTEGVLTPRLVVFGLGLSLVAGILTGLVPAWQSCRVDLAQALRVGGSGGRPIRSRLRLLLLLSQTAFSTLLLVGSGLFLRSLGEVEALDLGFSLKDVMLVRPQLESGIGAESAARMRKAALAAVSALPGVESVGAAFTYPFGGAVSSSVRVPGLEPTPSLNTGGPYVIGVEGRYFEALGIDIVKGRPFDERDRNGSAPVAVINQTMADLFFPSRDPIGRCMYVNDSQECTTVVGVAENTRQSRLVEERTMQYFVPASQGRFPAATFFLKAGPGGPGANALREAVYQADSRFRHVRAQRMSALADRQKRTWQLGATLFTVFGALALIVAVIGLYSVLAFDVAQHRREIGIRMALGASRGRQIASVVIQAARITTLGVLLGLGAAAVLASRIHPLLFETSAYEPSVYALVAASLLSAALLAATIPAWRAAAADPGESLRIE